MEEEFKTVVPGVMVSKKITISIPHPDPCWIIASAKGSRIVMVSGNQSDLLVFSSQKNAEELMIGEDYKGYSIEKFSWDELVDVFGTRFNSVLVDKKKEDGFYNCVPLQKGI